MLPPVPRFLGLTLLLGCAAASAWCGGSPSAPTPVAAPPVEVVAAPAPPSDPATDPVTPTAPPLLPPAPPTTWVNVFGDTGYCNSPVMGQLAKLMTNLGGDIFLAGDLAYPTARSTSSAAASIPNSAGFARASGRHRATTITRPAGPTVISATSVNGRALRAEATIRSARRPGTC